MTDARAAGDCGGQIRGIDLFAGLDQADVTRAVAGIEAIALAEGDEFEIAASGLSCCVVCSGRLALGFVSPVGGPRVVSLLEEGDVLVQPTATWAAMGPRLRCVAIEPSTVTLVEEDRLCEWMAEPLLARRLVQALSAQVAERELAVAIALEPRVERRLEMKLRQLAERFGRVTGRGIRLDLRLTHQQLADMIGAARESVTLAMGRLERQGVLTVRSRIIVIHASPELEAPVGAGLTERERAG